MEYEIKDVKFFEGGKAIFTVSNGKGKHYTYKICKPSKEKPFFVQLLTGPNNSYDYNYLGIYNPVNGDVFLTKASKFDEDSKPVKIIRWAIKMVKEKKKIPVGYKIQHNGKCCRCGRILTTPQSIKDGIGPICKDKIY